MKPTEFYLKLIEGGYNEEFKKFTRSIENNIAAVLDFENKFTQIFDDYDDSEEINDSLEQWEASESDNEIIGILLKECTELNDYVFDMPEDRMMGIFVDFINHGKDVTLSIGWLDSKVGAVVWNILEVTSEDPVLLFAEIGFFFDSHRYQCEKKSNQSSIPPMYAYHPERFKAFHDCAEEIGKIYRHKVDAKSGMLTLELLNNLMGIVSGELNKKGMKYPLKLKLEAPSPTFVIESMSALSTAYGRFVQAGRQIMDFPPSLIELLAETDMDDIPLNSIKTPYSSQYLYFGVQKHLELSEGWFVDGVYVEVRGEEGDIRFTVTAAPADNSLSKLWFVHPEPQYTQDFVEKYRQMDIATAIDTVLSDDKSNLNSIINKAGGDITDQVKANLSLSNESIPDSTTIIDVSANNAEIRLDQKTNRHPIYKLAIQLAVNALCYITAYPDDIATVWPKGTPTSLSTKADAGNGKESARAKSKLAALGYVPVHICGQRIEDEKKAAGHSGTTVKSHWRRGHWKNQVHGVGRSLRKLIWVMPTLVNAKNSKDVEGHIYLVS